MNILKFPTLLCCLLAFLGGPIDAQEVEVPEALAAPVEGEAVAPAGEVSVEDETEVSDEDKLDLLSVDAWPDFVEQLGPGARLHLAEDGFAQVEILLEDTGARAGLTITDLLGDADKLDSFKNSQISVAKFPAATASNLGNETEVLAGGRFQINMRADSTSFDEAMRIAWLDEHRSALNGLNPDRFSLRKWLVPILLGGAALFLLGILWISRGSPVKVSEASVESAGGRRRD